MVKILSDLLQGLELQRVCGDLRRPIHGLSYDSRQIKEGDLFVAIRGKHSDGHQFIGEAVRRGASAVIVEDLPENGVATTFVQVSDSRKILTRIAPRFYDYPARTLKLIGVTGTNGKTTTTLLLESILKQAGHGVGVIGTLGYRWADVTKPGVMTTPDASDLQKLFHEMGQDGISHVVMEVSSHALALGRVADCAFSAGVFTNLSQDHLDFHKTIEDYFEAKSLLFTKHLHIEESASVAVINADDPYGVRLSKEVEKNLWSYSVSALSSAQGRAGVRVKHAELDASGIRAELATPHGGLKLRSPLLGRLNLYNILAAATTALALGISKDAVSEGIEALHSVDGRLQRVPTSTGFDVVVDYAHTPDAMEKSLSCLRELTQGRLWVVFGCGGDRDRGKRPLMGKVAAQLGDLVILTSDNPRSESPEAIIGDIEAGVRAVGLSPLDFRHLGSEENGYIVEVNRKQAIQLALSGARPGDMIFIGGKGHETYQIIGNRRFSFDDRQVVREHLECLMKTSSRGEQS